MSVISEFFNEYLKIITNIFKFNYDFTFSNNLTNDLFKIDDNISFNYYEDNLPIDNLKYDSIIILDNFMSLLNYNNQRFNLMFHYEYNNTSNQFNLFGSNILDTIEWSNNQKINLNEIFNQSFNNNLNNEFIKEYYDTESELKLHIKLNHSKIN